MTEDQLRAIAAQHDATVRIKQYQYIYLSRYVPRATAQELGYTPSGRGGQSISVYVGTVKALWKLTEAQLLAAIARLPRRPERPLNEQEELEKAKRRFLKETGMEG